MKFAVIYTTFLRAGLCKRTLPALLQHKPADCLVVVVEQAEERRHGEVRYAEKYAGPDCVYVPLPYDAGLSAARNAGILAAAERSVEYSLVSADSIEFTSCPDLESISQDMERYSLDLVGFDLLGRVPWEGSLYMSPNRGKYPFVVKKGIIQDTVGPYEKVDICRNFFMATTASLHTCQWDERLKLREHEDWFWRWRLMNRNVWVTKQWGAAYVDDKPVQYDRMRQRMYNEFKSLVVQKYDG